MRQAGTRPKTVGGPTGTLVREQWVQLRIKQKVHRCPAINPMA